MARRGFRRIRGFGRGKNQISTRGASRANIGSDRILHFVFGSISNIERRRVVVLSDIYHKEQGQGKGKHSKEKHGMAWQGDSGKPGSTELECSLQKRKEF